MSEAVPGGDRPGIHTCARKVNLSCHDLYCALYARMRQNTRKAKMRQVAFSCPPQPRKADCGCLAR